MNTIDLPQPEPHARDHSQRLLSALVAELDADGPMGFDRYWERVLYTPGLGYYSAGARKFGADGDFVTAPELGDLFARCLAVALEDSLTALGQGDILEPGAGSGRLAADLLLALERRNCLPERYRILELSADLRQRQQQTLEQAVPHLLDRIDWLDREPDQSWQGVVVANEVVDALPARRFRRLASGWSELKVSHDQGRLCWTTAPPSPEDAAFFEQLEQAQGRPYPTGTETERQTALAGWVEAISRSLSRGRVLLIDYGYPRHEYYHPQRQTGTLICHYRHRAHDRPFAWPGLTDLSVSVDFTTLAEALEQAGLQVEGYVHQSGFLIDCGLQQHLEQALTEANETTRTRILHQVKMLTLPAEMGDRFQVISASRELDAPPRGFADNRLDRL